MEITQSNIDDFFQFAQNLGVQAENIKCVVQNGSVSVLRDVPGKPVRLYIPEHLLLQRELVDFETGKLKSPSDMEPATAEFMQIYVDMVLEPSKLNARFEFEKSFQEISDFTTAYGGIFYPFFKPTKDNAAARERLAHARTISYKWADGIVRPTFMPIMDFVNHAPANCFSYGRDKDHPNGLTISGEMKGTEVQAFYGVRDSLTMLGVYDFASTSHFAFSIPLEFGLPGGKQLTIKRSLSAVGLNKGVVPNPKIAAEADNLVCDYFLVASHLGPKHHVPNNAFLISKATKQDGSNLTALISRENLRYLFKAYQRAIEIPCDEIRLLVSKTLASQIRTLTSGGR